MNTFAIIDFSILIFYGLLIATTTIKNWNNPHKTPRIRNSELAYAVCFVLNGIAILFLFSQTTISPEIENILYEIIFIIFVAVLGWLWILNVVYTWLRI